MDKEDYIELRKSIRLEIKKEFNLQDKRRLSDKKNMNSRIDSISQRIEGVRTLVVRHLLTTSARENALIAEIDALKRINAR